MGNPAARKSIFKKLKIRYNEDMDRTTLTDFFEEVETTEEYNGYFCSIAEAISIVVLGSLCGLKKQKQRKTMTGLKPKQLIPQAI